MTTELTTLIGGFIATLAGGATAVWVSMQGMLKQKDDIIAQKDAKIEKLFTKTDDLQDQIMELRIIIAKFQAQQDLIQSFEKTLTKLLAPKRTPKKEIEKI